MIELISLTFKVLIQNKMILNITLKDSCVIMQLFLIKIHSSGFPITYQNGKASLSGFEQPTFRLTAERANRLRYRDDCFPIAAKFSKYRYNFRIHIYYFDILYAFLSLSDKDLQYENYF